MILTVYNTVSVYNIVKTGMSMDDWREQFREFQWIVHLFPYYQAGSLIRNSLCVSVQNLFLSYYFHP